jgi:hypothetical protein
MNKRIRRNPRASCRYEPAGRSRRHSGHATLRAFVAVFRAVRGFFRVTVAVFLALGAVLTADGISRLGCFGVRWRPWRSGWMRAVSSSVRN